MERLTVNNPKNNIETALNLFYVKNHETWIRGYGPAPNYLDVTLDDHMKMLIRRFLPDINIPSHWKDFSSMMAEWLFDDEDTIEGVLALLYSAAWAFAELRERLKKYEDIGLGPDLAQELVSQCKSLKELGGFDLFLEFINAKKEGRLEITPKRG